MNDNEQSSGDRAAADDVELIQLTDRLIRTEIEARALVSRCLTLEDEDRIAPQVERLYGDGGQIFDQIRELLPPVTNSGARALARAALATADRNPGGGLLFTGESEWLALSVAKFVMGHRVMSESEEKGLANAIPDDLDAALSSDLVRRSVHKASCCKPDRHGRDGAGGLSG